MKKLLLTPLTKITLLFVLIISFAILAGCVSGRSDIDPNQVEPNLGNSIIYGVFKNLKADTYSATFFLNNGEENLGFEIPFRKQFFIKKTNQNNIITYDVPFAFEIEPGRYEITRYNRLFIQKRSEFETVVVREIYSLIDDKSYSEAQILSYQNRYNEAEDSEKISVAEGMKKTEIVIPDNQIVYIGEWHMNLSVNPYNMTILDNKFKNDELMNKFYLLPTRRATSVVPVTYHSKKNNRR